MRSGDRIAANENVKKEAQFLADECNTLNVGFRHLLHAKRSAYEKFWDVVRAQHPELDDWEFRYSHKHSEIVLDRPKAQATNEPEILL